ncbi:MAG: zinc-dependent peptidase [Flammeovirgaceae bacterium]|nr:zinc-dependent peptidase [Flammeovirgaceae bacterium]
MHWLIFLLVVLPIPLLIASVAIREQRWFKKILFYHFPKYLRPISHQLEFINVYYNNLTPEKRKEFEWRAYYFLETTTIEFRKFGRSPLTNFNAIRYLIASVATQMTLFLTEDCFDAFKRIIVYPDKYYSPVTKQYHKGETNPALGLIVLSWQSFKHGFDDPNDGINLLVHELSHALWLENKLFSYEIFDSATLAEYNQIVERKISAIPENHFFRKYAFKNEEEFFAVAVENFFERPAQFKSELPELYEVMTRLLQQDPIFLNHK